MKVLVVLYLIGWVAVSAMMLSIRARLGEAGDPLGSRRPPWLIIVRCLAWPVAFVVALGSTIGKAVPLEGFKREGS